MYSRLRRVHEPQKRQDLAHRFVRVKRRLPNRLIGNAGTLKCLDQQAALRAQAVEHSEIGKRARRDLLGAFDPARVQGEIAGSAHHLLDLVHDEFSLGLVSRRLDHVKLNLIHKLRHRLDRLQPHAASRSSLHSPLSPILTGARSRASSGSTLHSPLPRPITCIAASRINCVER